MATKLTPTKADTARALEAATITFADGVRANEDGDDRELALIAEELIELLKLVKADADERIAKAEL